MNSLFTDIVYFAKYVNYSLSYKITLLLDAENVLNYKSVFSFRGRIKRPSRPEALPLHARYTWDSPPLQIPVNGSPYALTMNPSPAKQFGQVGP
jgi:hypothetical protein